MVLNIDLTPPGIALDSRVPAANAAGWNNSPVTVTWNCTDALSGPVAASDSVTVGSDGAAQSATGTCRDVADHVTTDSVEGINIDTAPPNITAISNIAPNGNGWHNTDVVVRFEASDTLSGIAFSSPDEIVSTEGSALAVGGTATDNAGLTASDSLVLKIDKTAPAIALSSRTPANAAGWNNTDVTLTWHCSDALSGPVDNQVSAALSGEGAAQNAIGKCADRADNAARATRSRASTSTRRVRPPDHHACQWRCVSAECYRERGLWLRGCAVGRDCVCGHRRCWCCGRHCDGRRQDLQRERRRRRWQSGRGRSLVYRAYAFSGFSNPIAAMPAMNTAKAGRTVPVKYSLRDVNGVGICRSHVVRLVDIGAGRVRHQRADGSGGRNRRGGQHDDPVRVGSIHLQLEDTVGLARHLSSVAVDVEGRHATYGHVPVQVGADGGAGPTPCTTSPLRRVI